MNWYWLRWSSLSPMKWKICGGTSRSRRKSISICVGRKMKLLMLLRSWIAKRWITFEINLMKMNRIYWKRSSRFPKSMGGRKINRPQSKKWLRQENVRKMKGWSNWLREKKDSLTDGCIILILSDETNEKNWIEDQPIYFLIKLMIV